MNTYVAIVILSAPSCFCFATYELFSGFNGSRVDTAAGTADTFLNSEFDAQLESSHARVQLRKNTSELQYHTTADTKRPTPLITTEKFNRTDEGEYPSNYTELTRKFSCPEEVVPSNIGPYEIPSQRDIVVFTRNILLDMFHSYNREAFYLLKDIRQATKATATVEMKCKGNKIEYRNCVKRVSGHCQQITKNLVAALGKQKQEIFDLIEENKCNLSEMKTDPIHIIKILAQEKISLEFALPGFLRLLNACSSYCIHSESNFYKNKPMRHMTDQDLVIKHFLTRKNYLELIMDSKHRTIANSN